MKTKLIPIMLTALFTVNAFADVELKRKDIKTVEDVKEYRAQVIDKMTERLDSGELNQKRANVLAKKIALLSDKPLPTQEQIDWRVENPSDIISMKRKGKMARRKSSSRRHSSKEKGDRRSAFGSRASRACW